MKRMFFVNAGDPDWQTTRQALIALDRAGVDWVELCVPFSNPFTDGAIIRASHRRAMHAGVDVHFVLRQLALLRGRLKLKVALMIDWSQSVRGTAMPTLIKEARAAGVNAVLLHGLPPRQRVAWNQCCRDYGIARVLTIYPESDLDGQDWTNLAFVYLVTRYGRAGTGAAATPANRVQLADAVRRVRSHTAMPIFFGFGIDTADAVRQAGDCGADGVVVGSHFVDWLHRHVQSGRVDTAALTAYAEQFCVPVDECRPAPFDLGVR